jgi:molybdenum cofactor cytidylyltransferase
LISAIVLSAGKSERMGRPKALLEFEGTTFLQRILNAIEESDIEGAVVVVVGHHRREIEHAVNLPAVVFNPDYEQGMSTSVQAGVRALPADSTGVALFLVDHPLVDAALINQLIPWLRQGTIVVPVHNGRRGHPVLFAADLFGEILALTPNQGLNTVVRKDPARVIHVPVADQGVLCDIDTPQQLEKLLRECE